MKSSSDPGHNQISRHRYQALFENSLAALFIAKPDGTILEANTAACRMFGYTPEEFRKLNRKDIIDPQTPGLDERFEEKDAKGKTRGELAGIRKNGERFTCEFTSSFFEDEDGEKLSSVMIIDISEKKGVQERMESITDNIPGVVFRYKLYPDGSDTLLHVSDGAKNVWGLPAEKVMQDNQLVWDLFHQDDIEEHKRTIRYSAENLTPWFHEWRIHHPDGHERWNRGIGKPTRLEDGSTIWDSIVMDITDEKKAKLEMELLINSTEESFILLDKELNIVSYNQQFKKLYKKYFGIKIRKGDYIVDYSQPERRDLVKKIYENVLAGKTETSEITIPVDDHNERIISLRFNPARNAESEVIGAFVTALDKTEEIQTRNLLEESNERYKYVTRATSDAIWEYVSETEKLVWEDGFKTLFGYKSNAEKKRQGIDHWLQKIHPEDKPRIEEKLKELWTGSGRKWDQEYRFKKADGTYAFVKDKAIILRDKNSKPARVIGTMQDITDRKQEEERLKLLESVVTHANDAVLITKADPLDAPDGPEIVYVNKAFEKMTGYKSEEVIGKTPRILQGPNSNYEELKKLGKALRRCEPYEMETINYRKNGEEFWISLSVSPVSNGNSTYSYFTAVERDITERKNRELQKSLVNNVSRIFSDSPNLKDALQEVTKKLKSFGDFCMAEVWLIDELNRDSSELKLSACYTESEMCKQFYQQTEDIISLKKGIGMPGITWKTGESQFWKSAGENETMVRKKAAKAVGIKTVYGFPITHNEKTLGCLVLGLDYKLDRKRYYMPLLEKFSINLGAEIQRKQVEDELSRIFSSAPDIICVAGFDGYFKKVNPAMIDMLGYTEKELLNKPIVDFVYPDDRNKTVKELNAISSGKGNIILDNRFITKSNNIIWLSWTFRSFYDEGYTFGVAKDVTERKKDAEQLSEKTSQLDAIAEFNGLLIKEDNWLDALEKSLPAFGKVVDADRVYFFENHLNETGQKESSMKLEWVAEDVEPQIDLPDHQAVPFNMMNEFIDPLSENRLFSTTVRTISSDDFRNLLEKQDIKSVLAVPVFTGKTFRGFIGFDDCRNERNWREEEFAFLRTISINLSSAIENEDAEIALQDAFEEKNTILESIADCFFAVKNDWTVTYWNNMAEKILGMPREKIVGENLWDLYEDAKELDFYPQYHKAMYENKTVHFEEYYPGTEMWLEVSAYPSSEGLSVFFKDITDRKKYEQRLKELNRSLEQHTKELAASNAELEQFAFVASHDLQEPLRMITSFLAQLERKYESVLDERAKKYIYFATDGAKRMRQIILDLLDYSRVGRVNNERSNVDLNQLFEDVVTLHKKIIGEKDAKISWDALPVIYAAKSPIQQVFQNLISNALHYHEGGNQPVVEVGYEETDVHWKFFVKDNGIGINPEYKDKIFNIFQRLHGKEEYSGTGVGLAICKKIVEEHGGEIYVESAEGEGSTFYFTIEK